MLEGPKKNSAGNHLDFLTSQSGKTFCNWSLRIKFLVQGCCGGIKHKTSKDADADNLPGDLSDPRNLALLPKPKSGCRGAYEIKDDGEVVNIEYEDTETLFPASDNNDPAQNLAYSAGNSSETIHAHMNFIFAQKKNLIFGTYVQKVLWNDNNLSIYSMLT